MREVMDPRFRGALRRALPIVIAGLVPAIHVF
jgi:hypothetical protein